VFDFDWKLWCRDQADWRQADENLEYRFQNSEFEQKKMERRSLFMNVREAKKGR